MRSPNKPVITLLFILLLISIACGEEQEPMLKTKTRTMDGISYLYWKVSSMMDNSSNVIQFNVKYCPVDDKCKVNITICKANYTALPLYGTTSTNQEAFYSANGLFYGLFYDLANGNLKDQVIRRDKSLLLSSAWNRSSRQFMCAIHNVKECQDVFGEKSGVFMITTSFNYTKLVIIKSAHPLLTMPASLAMTQNDNAITIKWRRSSNCVSDVPDLYHLLLKNHETGQEIPGSKHTFGKLSKEVWQYTFQSIDPYTIYTVSVYGVVILGNRKGPRGELRFRTAEAAPSEAPSIRCSMCVPSKYFQNYRNVTVMWDLPPKNRLNGIIRQAILRFWEEGTTNTTFTLKVHNSTVAVLSSLKRNSKYNFQVKVCTVANRCSAYSKQSNILEEVANRTGSKNLAKAWMIGLLIGLLLVIVVAVVLLYGFISNRRHRKSEETEMKNIKLSEKLYLPQSTEQLAKTESLANMEEYHSLPDMQEKHSQTI